MGRIVYLKKAEIKRAASRLKHFQIHELFMTQCAERNLPVPEREARFHPIRKYRADFLFRQHNLIVEIDGGVFNMGAHTRGAGYTRDRERDAEAMILGFKTLRVTPEMVYDQRAINYTTRLICGPELEH